MNIDTNIRKIQRDVRKMQRNLINITKELETVTTKLARANNGLCSNCSNFDAPTEPSSDSSNDDSEDYDSDDDYGKPSGDQKKSKPERTTSSTSITTKSSKGRTTPTAFGTRAYSSKRDRERHALIIALMSPEERKKFYDHLSQWIKTQFGRSHSIEFLHLSLSTKQFELLQLHQNWWIRINLRGPIERLQQMEHEDRAERRSSKKRKHDQGEKKR